jgi:hypothetical protein
MTRATKLLVTMRARGALAHLDAARAETGVPVALERRAGSFIGLAHDPEKLQTFRTKIMRQNKALGSGRPPTQVSLRVTERRMLSKWKENAILRERARDVIPCFASRIPCFSSEQGNRAKALTLFGDLSPSGALKAEIGRKSQKFAVTFPVCREFALNPSLAGVGRSNPSPCHRPARSRAVSLAGIEWLANQS